MSDSWRPFTLRRSEGGDLVRAGSGWQGALRFGVQDFDFDVVEGTTLDGIPVEYDSTLMSIQVPPTVPSRGEMVLVRGGFGYPNSPLDGVPVWYHPDNKASPLTAQYNQLATDQPLTGGHWYYYSLFVKLTSLPYPQPSVWTLAATKAVLVPRYYAHDERLIEMIPPFYVRLDDQQAADGRNGPLRKFSRVMGYEYDYERTLLDGVLNVYHPDLAPLMFIQQVGANLGLPIESSIGGARYRALVGQLWDLEGARGTLSGLQALISAVSDYDTVVVPGYNSLLAPDDAEFVDGVGHWQMYTNPHYTDFINGVSSAHPIAGLDLSRVAVRVYGASDLLPPATYGRKVLEIVELTTTATMGMYGVPGTITGPQAPFANLAALQGASPAVGVSAVPNYYPTTTNPWWFGDYVVLGDGSFAYWTGSAWAAGKAPNTGGSVRPAMTTLVAGSPGYATPFGALLPANQSALGDPTTVAVPPVEWKAGDYIQAQDGTQWHPYWYSAQSHPVIGWTSGPGVLTLPATQGTLGYISGYLSKWTLSDGSSAIAPASLVAAQTGVPMVVGRAQSADPYRPWHPTATQESYEYLRCYNNDKIAWNGWKRYQYAAGPTQAIVKGGPLTLDTSSSISTNYTAWADAGARAASAMTSSCYAFFTGQSGTTPALPGLNKIVFPAAGLTLTGWTNPSSDGATFVPTAHADARIHATIQSATAFPTGTYIALFVNNAEIGRITTDGIVSYLSIHADITVLAGQTLDVRVFNPGTTNIDLTINNTNYYQSPSLRVYARVAYAANQVWVAPGTRRVHVVIGFNGITVYLMKNGRPVAWKYGGSDTAAVYTLEADVDVVANDQLWVGAQIWYYPASVYQNIISGQAPQLAVARWETVT